MILISMMVLCTQVNKMYVIATLSVYPHRASLKNMPGHTIIEINIILLDYIGIEGIRLSSEISYTDRVAQLAEHWASIPRVVGSNPTVARHIFQACPVWIYTQSSNYMHLIHLST